MDKTTAITLVLAAPRGFCAGVERAVLIVERALEQFGAPVYVRHEIVHNAYVVDTLRAKGAIFIEELSDIPPVHHDRPVIFSAHGVPKSVPAEAQAMNLLYIDATCPLVSKVHNEAERHHREGRHIVLIGHKGHPEVIGTMGQLPDGAVTLVETVADVEALQFSPDVKLAYTTQTTLSVDDTAAVVLALRSKFPAIMGPQREDICYATTNRQDAVKALAAQADVVLVIGAPNSSNANRLVEVARAAGVKQAMLIQGAQDIPFDWIVPDMRVGIASGASTPEVLVDAVRKALVARYTVTTEDLILRTEDVTFRLPKPLRDEAA